MPRPVPPSLAECMALLNLTGPASVDQIKRAYRNLAQRLHPDKNHGDEAARSQFVKVSEAYRILVRAARVVAQGGRVGVCAACGGFDAVSPALDGSHLCGRCILRPGGGRLLPMPVLVVAKCFGTMLLMAITAVLFCKALQASEPRLVSAWAAAATVTGLCSLAALAFTCLRVVHCITDQERSLIRDYRRTESRHRSWLRARRRDDPPATPQRD